MASEKSWLSNILDENTNTENENTVNDSQKIWPKERILRTRRIYLPRYHMIWKNTVKF